MTTEEYIASVQNLKKKRMMKQRGANLHVIL